MTNQSVDDSQFLTTVGPYLLCIVLGLASFQVIRQVLLMILPFLQTLVRAALLVLSWPVHLLTLPVRALIFLTTFTLKIALCGAAAAIVYMLLAGVLTNSKSVKEAIEKVWYRLQDTVLNR